MVVEEGNIQLDVDVPGNDDVNPDEAVTSEGINVNPDDAIVITSPEVDGTFRAMDVEFTVEGASTVTVTFVRPNEPDVVIEVQ